MWVASAFGTNLFPSSKLYSPIKESLVTQENPPKYKEATLQAHVAYLRGKRVWWHHLCTSALQALNLAMEMKNVYHIFECYFGSSSHAVVDEIRSLISSICRNWVLNHIFGIENLDGMNMIMISSLLLIWLLDNTSGSPPLVPWFPQF